MRTENRNLSGVGSKTTFLLLALILLATACDGTQLPRVIARYPQGDAGQQGQVAAPSFAVTEARVELSVPDISRAAAEVADLAAAYGGTLLDEQRWRSRGAYHASITLLLPVYRFDAFLRGLQEVGEVQSQRLTESGAYGRRDTHVTVLLHEETASQRDGWDPALTFSKAFAVFLGLFQTMVDGLIWVVVVAGPFVLMALGLLVALRRVRRGPAR